MLQWEVQCNFSPVTNKNFPIGERLTNKKSSHGIKNRYGERTEKEANFWFSGQIGVQSMVEPVTS